ncbi:MAG: hypothetical protein IBX68_11605 [Dehalococcoidia bacterium]|nr:hypothetical protein [Dehalococcoidia bacterium]
MERAKRLADRARLAMFDVDAFPGIDGEIMIGVYYKRDYLEFIIEQDGLVTFSHEVGEREVASEDGLHLNDAIKKLGQFSEDVWNLSELSTASTLIGEDENSRAWHLEILVAEASQLFQQHVLPGLGTQSASILKSSTGEYLQYQPSSGSSAWRNYPASAVSKRTRVIPEMSVTEISRI